MLVGYDGLYISTVERNHQNIHINFLKALSLCCQLLRCLSACSVYSNNYHFATTWLNTQLLCWVIVLLEALPQAVHLATFWQNSDSLEQCWEKWFMLEQWFEFSKGIIIYCQPYKVVTIGIHWNESADHWNCKLLTATYREYFFNI